MEYLEIFWAFSFIILLELVTLLDMKNIWNFYIPNSKHPLEAGESEKGKEMSAERQ